MPDQSRAADEHAILQEITAPLASLPDDPLPTPEETDFPRVRRGYDPLAVDAYVRRMSQLIADLQARNSPDAAVRRALERVGEQISGILQRAHDTAEQITTTSRREAEDRLEQARQEAIEIARAGEQRIKDLDADADRIWAERLRIIEDARELAAQLTALADTAAERFPPAEEATGGVPAVEPAVVDEALAASDEPLAASDEALPAPNEALAAPDEALGAPEEVPDVEATASTELFDVEAAGEEIDPEATAVLPVVEPEPGPSQGWSRSPPRRRRRRPKSTTCRPLRVTHRRTSRRRGRPPTSRRTVDDATPDRAPSRRARAGDRLLAGRGCPHRSGSELVPAVAARGARRRAPPRAAADAHPP